MLKQISEVKLGIISGAIVLAGAGGYAAIQSNTPSSTKANGSVLIEQSKSEKEAAMTAQETANPIINQPTASDGDITPKLNQPSSGLGQAPDSTPDANPANQSVDAPTESPKTPPANNNSNDTKMTGIGVSTL